jgi:hypothetical protein
MAGFIPYNNNMKTVKHYRAFQEYKKYLTKYEKARTISTWTVIKNILIGWFTK